MNETETLTGDLEISFDDLAGEVQQVEAETPTPQVAEAKPAPQAPASQPPAYGPNYSMALSRYQQAEAEYKSVLEQVKKLRSIGADVPPELEAQIAQYAAEIAILKRDVEEAKRKDALGVVSGLVGRYSGSLPPDVAKVVGPVLQDTFARAVAANPDIINDPNALEGLANFAIGSALKSRLGRSRPAGIPQATSAPTPPPQPTNKTPEVPDIAKRFGVAEAQWAKVADLDPFADRELEL